MTLHEAMREVISSQNRMMTADEIADLVNEQNLYSRGDGTPVPPSQIRARARKYSGMFKVFNGLIGLAY